MLATSKVTSPTGHVVSHLKRNTFRASYEKGLITTDINLNNDLFIEMRYCNILRIYKLVFAFFNFANWPQHGESAIQLKWQH